MAGPSGNVAGLERRSVCHDSAGIGALVACLGHRPVKPIGALAVLLALIVMAVPACSISAGAAGSAKSGQKAGESSPSADDQPPPPPPAPSAATPEADEPARVDELDCPWLIGGHLNGLGPNSLVMVAGAAQPGVCWLEVSLGVGFGAGRYSASAAGLEARGQYSRFAVPLRGRVWFMEQGHSFVGDLGLGATHYRMQAASANGTNGYLDYTRNSTPFLSTLALGYGWRPEGSQPGYRFTAMLGGVLHPTRMKDSSFDTNGDFSAAVAGQLSTALDERTQDFTDPSLFAEVSLGLLF